MCLSDVGQWPLMCMSEMWSFEGGFGGKMWAYLSENALHFAYLIRG